MDCTCDPFCQFPSFLSVSWKEQENCSRSIRNLDEPVLSRVLSLLPITRLKPSGELCRIVLVDCNSLIEGVLFNFTFLKSISYLLKFLIQLLCYFPIFLFATFQWPVHISVSLSLFASVVISKWNILHRMPQIQKEGHAHSITNIALNCQTSDGVWWDYFQLP